MKVVAYVPMKLNNERLPNKNTKAFSNGKPLLSYILETLTCVNNIDEVYAYCSDSTVKDYLPESVHYLSRSKDLDQSTTKINEVMTSFARDVDADIYVLAHATAPFISKDSIELGVNKVLSEGFDSALSVLPLYEFLWKGGQPFNYDVKNVPRTQDLSPMYQETTGLYIYKKGLIVNENRRIGDNPYLIEVSKIEAVDINEPIDFVIADALASSSVVNI
jgi:CMP-N-acetylneuraminic acid synthetase